jgi:hypothetical protein
MAITADVTKGFTVNFPILVTNLESMLPSVKSQTSKALMAMADAHARAAAALAYQLCGV